MIKTLPTGRMTPLAAYSALADGSRDSFLLESAEVGSKSARFSFIGSNPKFILKSSGQVSEIDNENGTRTIDTEPLEFLRTYFSAFELQGGSDLPPFISGAVGYIGFDCVGWFERTLVSENAVSALMFFDSAVVFDHLKQNVLVVTLSSEKGEFRSKPAAQKENERIEALLLNAEEAFSAGSISHDLEPPVSNFAKCDFERSVDTIKELINAGECYQVVLSQRFERQTDLSPVSIYRNLRSMNPSPYMFLLEIDGKSMIGSSPETLVAARGDDIYYKPIAGTRRRGSNNTEDARLADEMRKDPKEVAEHMMLVDLGRNDLGRIAKFGSVRVDKLMAVEKFSHVQHLVSELSAALDPKHDRFDALASCFPAGTVSGAPKVRAVEIIRSLEPQPRGIYAGAVGYFDYGRNIDTCIAIRTIELENGVARIQAGAGIVADSVPENEYFETVNKAKAMLRAIGAAEGGK